MKNQKFLNVLLLIIICSSLFTLQADSASFMGDVFSQMENQIEDGYNDTVQNYKAIFPDSVFVQTNNEGISVTTVSMSLIDSEKMDNEISEYVYNEFWKSNTNVTTIKKGIQDICQRYGIENPNIDFDSSIGENQIVCPAVVEGYSMDPTLKEGQSILLNKSCSVHENDIVFANTTEYGEILTRVTKVEGDKVFIESDNKEVRVKDYGDYYCNYGGESGWIDVKDIYAIVIDY